MTPRALPLLLAFDAGSTNFKAALFDAEGRRLAEHAEAVRYAVRDGVRAEMDPEEIWEIALRTLRGVCRAADIVPAAIRTLAFSSQAQTFTVCDEGGRAFLPLMSWLDKRATEESALLDRRFSPIFHQHCSIAAPIPQLQIAKALWAQRHFPTAFGRGRRLTALPGFLALRVAGVNATDPNLAAMGGLYSLRARDWWSDALAATGLDAAALPDLVRLGEAIPLRRAHPDFPLHREVRVVFAGNDQTCGMMGTARADDEWIATLGTALVLYRCAGEQSGPFHPAGVWGPWPLGGFYELATRDEGCVALDWARERLLPDASPDAFAREASRADPVSAPFFFPAAIYGPKAWSASAAPAEMAYAAYEGVLFSLRELVAEISKGASPPRRLGALGGGSRSDFGLQLMADILDRPVRRGSGDALDGAARIARGARPPREADDSRSWAPAPGGVRLRAERYARWKAAEPSRSSPQLPQKA